MCHLYVPPCLCICCELMWEQYVCVHFYMVHAYKQLCDDLSALESGHPLSISWILTTQTFNYLPYFTYNYSNILLFGILWTSCGAFVITLSLGGLSPNFSHGSQAWDLGFHCTSAGVSGGSRNFGRRFLIWLSCTLKTKKGHIWLLNIMSMKFHL